MATKWLFVAPVAGALGIGAGIGADQLLSAAAAGRRQAGREAGGDSADHPRRAVQQRRRLLLALAARSTDDARVDLTFPEQDINDLLKSMVLEDFNGGRIAAVSYDSREPIARTLSSFAINLNGNPTFAGIVSQMRGERVEVGADPGAANQPGKLIGRHRRRREAEGRGGQRPATVDVEVLNMWCAEGLRAVKLPDVQQLQVRQPGDRERVPPGAGRAGAVATTARRRR